MPHVDVAAPCPATTPHKQGPTPHALHNPCRHNTQIAAGLHARVPGLSSARCQALVVGRPRLAADCDCVDLLSVPLSAGAEGTPPVTSSCVTSLSLQSPLPLPPTSFLVLGHHWPHLTTSLLTNHYLSVTIYPPTRDLTSTFTTTITLFPALLVSASRALRCSDIQPAVRHGLNSNRRSLRTPI